MPQKKRDKMGKFSAAIFSRQKKGLNTIILIVGARGIGKSYLALKLGETYDKNFSVENVTFNIENFLIRVQILRTGKWAWLIFDEIGLEVAARDFMSMVNKVMSYVAQSFRYTKINLVAVCPDPDMVDIHVRKLSDFWILVTNRGHARVFKTKMNPFRSGGYYTPLFCDLRIPLPSPELCEAYEEKRHLVLEEKYYQYLEEIQAKGYVPKTVDWNAKARELRDAFEEEGIPRRKWAAQIKIREGVAHVKAYEIKALMESLE
jgi:hypothetical protein